MAADQKSRQERVYLAVQEHTRQILRDEIREEGATAEEISRALSMDRANVSRELNALYKAGQLIKIQGKPTLYLCRATLSDHDPGVFSPPRCPRGAVSGS